MHCFCRPSHNYGMALYTHYAIISSLCFFPCSVKKQPENEYECITPKPRAYETVASDHKPVTMDKNPAYQSTVLGNKTTDNHPPEYEVINLQPTTPNTDDVKMEKNPAYAETHFK